MLFDFSFLSIRVSIIIYLSNNLSATYSRDALPATSFSPCNSGVLIPKNLNFCSFKNIPKVFYKDKKTLFGMLKYMNANYFKGGMYITSDKSVVKKLKEFPIRGTEYFKKK